jgi:hypothetical protein
VPYETRLLTKQWRNARRFQESMYGGIQATLHNIHRKEGQPPFTSDMFMSGYLPPKKDLDDSWKGSKRAMQLICRKPTKETIRENRFLMTVYRDRVSQARDLPPDATREQIQALMEG